MKTKTLAASLALIAGGLVAASAAQARDQIRIVGSSTVYPFTTAVAEQLGRSGGVKTPVVESTGTGGGMKLFCSGVGVEHPDATNASRRMKKGEFEACQKAGVKDIIEITVGYDGITLTQSKEGAPVKITLGQLFLAIAKQVPGPDGKLVANPHKNWSDIDKSLPNVKIEVLGPPPTSGTRDALHELLMEPGAEQIPALVALKKGDRKAFDAAWKSLREDGAYVEAGENDNLIVQKLVANKNAFGIFGYSFLEENTARLRGVALDGVEPERLLMVFTDLTPLRRVEEMRADFVANASHELRTPLAALSGFIDTLQGPAREDTTARERFLAIMKGQAERMGRLIDDLLSLSRIELNEHVRPDAPVELVPVVSQVVDELQLLARERGVEIAVDAATPVTVPGDRDELLRAFENLVENALKYGGAGHRVEIRVEPPAPGAERGEARVSVRDFGPGIAPEHLPRLTERFYRVDIGHSRAEGGTGLGLSLVKHILNRHRGRLLIESAPGAGSTFTAALPAHLAVHRGKGE